MCIFSTYSNFVFQQQYYSLSDINKYKFCISRYYNWHYHSFLHQNDQIMHSGNHQHFQLNMSTSYRIGWNTSLHFLRICRHCHIYSLVLTWICNKQLTSNVRYKFCKIYEHSKCLVDTLEKICRMLNNVENVRPVFLLLKLYLLRKNSLTVSFKQENVSESIFCFNDPMVTFTLYWYLRKIIKMK